MKNKKIVIILAFVMLFVCSLAFVACKKDDPVKDDSGSGTNNNGGEQTDNPTWSISSPEGDIILDAYFVDNQLYYAVKKGSVTVIEKSKLGMSTNKNEFTDMNFVEKSENQKTISYTNVSGKVKEVTTSFKELTLTFSEENFLLDVILRVYHDGFAFRYNIREAEGKQGKMTITDEASYFAFPQGTSTYGMEAVTFGGIVDSDGEYFAYEDKYQYRSYKNIANEKFAMPFLATIADTDESVNVLITESDIYGHDYHGSALFKDGDNGLKTVHMPACGTNASLEAEYPFTSPWRVAVVGGLDTITESTLVEDVYDEIEPWKPDNYESLSAEEKAIYTYDWVEPGVAAWSYLNYDNNKYPPQHNWELQKTYVDAIADLGWTWLVLDAGWDHDFVESEFTAFTKYCNDKNVHVMVWADSFASFYSRTQTKITLKQWQSWGIEGVKIDFFDGQGVPALSDKAKLDSQWSLDEHYEMFYQEAAAAKMVVDCHGCNKPSGERRKYPNVINREGIRGNEFKSVDAKQTVILPLTRCTIGPSDFTPAIIPYWSNTVTTAHNMGIAITMESGMPTFSDVPEHYTSGEYLDFYRNLPVVWDETRLVKAKLGDYVVIARRSGNKWWVGGCSAYKDSITIDLSFLSSGEYTATVYTDGDDYTKVNKSQQNVTEKTSLTLDVQKGGGFALTIE